MARILGIPETWEQVALIPVAYTTGGISAPRLADRSRDRSSGTTLWTDSSRLTGAATPAGMAARPGWPSPAGVAEPGGGGRARREWPGPAECRAQVLYGVCLAMAVTNSRP